ncbi:MAG: glycosyltransferase [Aeromonas sp.]
MKVVISGVNLVEGGTLKVFQDVISAFDKVNGIELICLVHSKKYFYTENNITFIEYPTIKKSWLLRCFFEYIYCWFLSKKIKPDVWLAMHDMSPNLYGNGEIKQFVYCHNPSPTYEATWKDFRFNKKFFIFSKLYRYVYKINIQKNNAVICQQKWFGDLFKKELGAKNVIIAKPNVNVSKIEEKIDEVLELDRDLVRFFYPALPRTFKNFELILDAISVIETTKLLIDKKIEVILTFDGDESIYSRWLLNKYTHLQSVKFVGRLSREQVNAYYKSSDLILFPSKLETWGLPIVEAKEFGKYIFLADLPYAHETLGSYDKAKFIDVNDHEKLAKLMLSFVNGDLVFDAKLAPEDDGILPNWDSLVSYLLMA